MNKLLLVDFDNTLANTADVIRVQGYQYEFEHLKPYKGSVSYVKRFVDSGGEAFIISKRPEKHRPMLQNFVNRNEIPVGRIILVRWHVMKWFYSEWFCRAYERVVIVDDMLVGEETGVEKELFFPPLISRKGIVIRGEAVQVLRGGI